VVRVDPTEPPSISADVDLVVQILRRFSVSLAVVVAEEAGDCFLAGGSSIHGAMELSLESLDQNTWRSSSSIWRPFANLHRGGLFMDPPPKLGASRKPSGSSPAS
jgi:hypothetical protein